jgi:Notch-like protein
VCSGVTCGVHGTCVAPDICDCDDGWDEDECDKDISLFDTYVNPNCTPPCLNGECYFNGTDHLCACEDHWHGDLCNITNNNFTCGGILYTDETVCNGRGICIDDDECSCISPYDPLTFCEELFICNGISSKSRGVCGKWSIFPFFRETRGRCVGNNVCECFPGYKGKFCEKIR